MNDDPSPIRLRAREAVADQDDREFPDEPTPYERMADAACDIYEPFLLDALAALSLVHLDLRTIGQVTPMTNEQVGKVLGELLLELAGPNGGG